MLNYHLDCDPLKSILRVEYLLTNEVKGLVMRITTETVDVRALAPDICEELCQARVFSCRKRHNTD